MNILNYDTNTNHIELLKKFSDVYPGVDIYSPLFKDKFQEYIDNITSDMNLVIDKIKTDVCSNPKLELSNEKIINISDVFTVQKKDNINIINFTEDVAIENVAADKVESITAEFSTIKTTDAEIGDLKISSSGLSLLGSNIANNESDGSAKIKNLTIENNLIVKGAIKSLVPDDDSDYYYDFGFMTVSRTSGETIIEFKQDSGFILEGSAYIGNVRTKENMVLTQEYIKNAESKFDDLIEKISKRVSEFWNDININDFICKVLVNSKTYYGNFNNDSFKCEFDTDEAELSSIVLDLSNAPVGSSVVVSKILVIDSNGINHMYGPGYDDTPIEVLDSKVTVPSAMLTSSPASQVWIKTVITDTSSNKASSATFIIKVGD